MKKNIFPVALSLILLPVLGMGQSALDGTWKVNLDNAQFAPKPEVYLLQNGTYQCKTCAPPITVKAAPVAKRKAPHPELAQSACRRTHHRDPARLRIHALESGDPERATRLARGRMVQVPEPAPGRSTSNDRLR